MARTVVAIRHVAFEDLGSFAPALRRRGYAVSYREAGVDGLDTPAVDAADLLVVLGGPVGAYEEGHYPFLADELRLLERRLRAGRATLGICLGAQLVARALGARVYPGPAKEIGFAPVALTPEGLASPLAPLTEAGAAVLHWHGDTFDLPAGAVRLASTPATANQAFAVGRAVLGLQFHPEATLHGFEHWLVGHAAELAAAGVEPGDLRAQAARHAPALEARAARMLDAWLNGLPD